MQTGHDHLNRDQLTPNKRGLEMSMLRISGVLIIALGLILATGCSKKQEKEAPEPTEQSETKSGEAEAQPSAKMIKTEDPVSEPAPPTLKPPSPEARPAPVAPDSPAEALLGKWENKELELSFEFKADGTFILSDGGEKESGRFSLSEVGALELESNDVFLDLPIELKDGSLFITDMDGETVELKRVK